MEFNCWSWSMRGTKIIAGVEASFDYKYHINPVFFFSYLNFVFPVG